MSSQKMHWPALTRALDDPLSPVRQAVDRLLTDRDGVRDLQRSYREAAGPMLVDSRGGNAGTIGTATDLLYRFLFEASPDMRLAVRGARALGEPGFQSVVDLVARIGGRISQARSKGPTAAEPLHKVLEPLLIDLPQLARACWALALLVEVYRVGGIAQASPISALTGATVTVDDYLGLATDNDVQELVKLAVVAQTHMLPQLKGRASPWFVGPAFSGSAFMDADADLIAGGLLLEIKTNLGDKQKDGSRRCGLKSETLRQLLGYVLHDLEDDFKLTHVGVFDARYGLLQEWPLLELLDKLAGAPMDLAAERAAYAELLRTGMHHGPVDPDELDDNSLYYVNSPRELREFLG